MNTNDKTPPAGTVEEDLSSEEKVMHQDEAKLLAAMRVASARPTDGMPQADDEELQRPI